MTKYIPVQLVFNTVEPDDYEEDIAPIIFLHGLAGSKEDWDEIPRNIANATNRKVFAIDARNHGDTEWTDVFNFDCNVDDLVHFMDQNGISKAVLVGHSMGGFTAINTALKEPERVEKIVVIDISPKKLPKHMFDLTQIFASVGQLALRHIPKGTDIETAKKIIIAVGFRNLPKDIQSITNVNNIKNIQLKPTHDGRFEFKTNFKSLLEALKSPEGIMTERTGVSYKPALFIYGELSALQVNTYEEYIKTLFPKYKLVGIEKAKHNVHQDCPEEFTEGVIKFIQKQ